MQPSAFYQMFKDTQILLALPVKKPGAENFQKLGS